MSQEDHHIKTAVLYRYRTASDFTFNEIRNSEIYFQQRKYLNDPFDCNIDIHDLISALINQKGTPGNGALKKLIANKDLFSRFHSNAGKLGIACFTDEPKNAAMWAHYTDNHKGVCIKYEFPLYFLDDGESFFGAAPIEYEENRISRWLRDNGDKAPGQFQWFIETLIKLYVTSKSSYWESENEFRIIRPVIGLFSFAPEYITQVTLGLKSTTETLNKVKEVTEGRNIKLVKLVSAPNGGDFDLDLVPA